MANTFDALTALIDQFIPTIRDAFAAAIQDITDNAILTDVIKAIQQGDLDKAFRAIGFSDAAMRPISQAIEAAFETGGVTVGGTFPKYLNTPTGRAVFRFDVRNSRAETWLRNESGTLITRLQGDALTAVRNVVSEGMQAGRNPRLIALDLVGRIGQNGHREGGIVGLSTPFERAVSRSRLELQRLDPGYFNRLRRDKRFDGVVRKAIAADKPLDGPTIDKLVSRYSDSLLQLRGENIARTEAISSLNRSEWEAVKQASDMGAIVESQTTRIWDTAGDTRVRHSHEEMEGQSVGIDEPFVTGSGDQLMYPGDTSLGAGPEETINCRCRARLKVDWLAGTF